MHTDITQESGPAVLRHVLANVHQWPSAGVAATEGAGSSASAATYTDAVLSGERDCRYLFINLWRSTDTDHTVSTWPLALLHPSSWSVAGTDHAIEHSKRAGSIFPQNYVMRAAGGGCDKHEWFVFPHMVSSEGIVFVNYDSDPAAPQHVFHGACDMEWPELPPELPPPGATGAAGVRTSVEVRLLVIVERDGVRRRVCGTKGLWRAGK